MQNDKDRYWDCLDQAMEASHGGRTEEALAWLDEALKAQPGGAEAHNGRGEILWDEGRIEEALFEFERAIETDRKFTAAHMNRAELLIEEMGEFEAALAAREQDGYLMTTISDMVAHLELSGVERRPAPALVDGTWQAKSTDSIHRWMGGRSDVFAGAEEDNAVRSGNPPPPPHNTTT